MDQAIYFLLGLAAATAAYFLKRWWEQRGPSDAVQQLLSIIQLHKGISGEDRLTAEALEALRQDIIKRNRLSREGALAVFESIRKVSTEKTANFESVFQNQREMNRHEHHLADLAEQELRYLVEVLESKMTEAEAVSFGKTQRAWLVFARRQADFASLIVEGGSMQPMVRSSEYRALTIERAARVKEEIRQRTDDLA